MSDPLMPGVYWEDVVPPPAPSFLTGVPAFLGWTAAGPYTPQRVALWPGFAATFGSPAPAAGAPGGFLADAVRGFFENDGLLCYVVRLDGIGSVADQLRRALDALDDLDDVDLVCAPDLVVAVAGAGSAEAPWPAGARLEPLTDLQRTLLRHCQERGDRFALLDAVPALDPELVAAQRDLLAGPDGASGALYHPWLGVPGPDGTPRYVPPCGQVAGTYSRSDRRTGVHKAPANEVIEGVLDLQTDLTAQEAGALYQVGVNSVRAFPGRGIRVWGARTLATDPAWREVNVRRLVGTLGRWLERFMAGLVYEPNDVRLWVRIVREVTAYLDRLYQRGALRGRTADEAFYVKCDSATNPPEVTDAGMVVTEIGVAPTAPAEFIVVRVIHGASGVTVSVA